MLTGERQVGLGPSGLFWASVGDDAGDGTRTGLQWACHGRMRGTVKTGLGLGLGWAGLDIEVAGGVGRLPPQLCDGVRHAVCRGLGAGALGAQGDAGVEGAEDDVLPSQDVTQLELEVPVDDRGCEVLLVYHPGVIALDGVAER